MEFALFAVVAFGVLVVLGIVAAVIGLAGWLIALPFRLLGLAFHFVAALLALPLLALFGVLGFVIFGLGAVLFLIPVMPFFLLAGLIWWLMHRKGPQAA